MLLFDILSIKKLQHHYEIINHTLKIQEDHE